MPALVCAARTCVYNKDEYCSKGDIRIGGDHATNSFETCCTSFEERRGNNSANTTGSASSMIDVDCTACNCTYNEEKKCSADKIGVSGSSAHDSEETSCGTFRCE